jgi:hypothetical protein
MSGALRNPTSNPTDFRPKPDISTNRLSESARLMKSAVGTPRVWGDEWEKRVKPLATLMHLKN